MTRASTMLLALLVLNVLLGALCLVVARSERKSPSLRLWGWGLLMYSAGILITIPAFLPFDLRKILGNALIAYAPILIADGVLRHTKFRLDRRWTTAAFVVSVLPIVVNHVDGHYLALIDFLAPAPIANVLFLIAAYQLLRNPPQEAKVAARFLAGILLFSVLVWTARMVGIVLSLEGSNDRDRADTVVALFAIAQLINSVGSTLGLLWVEVRKMEAELRRLAYTDALTSLPNRRATLEHCAEQAARAERDGRGFALLILDVDHFKRINDNLGHLVGDAALQQVACALAQRQRERDLIGRIGGEEFAVLIDEPDPDKAMRAAERLCAAVAATQLPAASTTVSITMSGGLAMFPPDGKDWDQLFAVADRRLYMAKESGRNRVVAQLRSVA